MTTEVRVPALGESITEATLGKWLKATGEAVAADEAIAALETDKVAIDVNAPVAGTMGQQIVAEGANVLVGALIATIEAGGAGSAALASPAPAGLAADAHDPLTLSPAVRRLVLEHGVDPTRIKGSGKEGRLTKEDVLGAVSNARVVPQPTSTANVNTEAATGLAEASQPAPLRHEERVRMTRLRQTVAARLKEAQNTAALLTTFNDVDMSAVIAARAKYKDLFEKKHGVRLGFMGFFVKAACMALRDIPAVNGRIDGDEIVYHDYADISVAVSAPNGLVVPVIRDAQALSVAQIETTIGDFGARAKAGTLTMGDMKGGTFTISNGGVFGSLMSTPIINPPQSAVLGLHRIEDRPVVRDGQVVVRPMMYLALSYDHRLIDGREAVTFLVALKNAIEDPTRLLIDL